MLRTRRRLMAAVAVATLVAGCRRATETDPGMVSVWMRTLYGAIRVERLSPPVASRIVAYAATALYSGLAATSSDAMPALSGMLNGLAPLPAPERRRAYDPTLTAVAAEQVVLDSLLREGLPTTRAAVGRLVDSLAQARRSQGVDDELRTRSQAYGRRIGLAVVAWSRGDGFDGTRGRPYVAPVGEGLWLNDAPGSVYAAQNISGATQFVGLDNPANALRPGSASDRGLILSRSKLPNKTLPAVNMAGTSEPYWGEIRPFALRRWNECAVPEPYTYARDSAAALYRDARALVALQRHLTPEQRSTALFWADNAGESGTPVGHWLSIAGQMVSERHLSAHDAARLMVLTAVAQADAFIAAWGYKYQYHVIRPRTYIRRVIDSTWEPAIPTPPFPEYPSGHSAQSAAAAAVMTALMGPVAFDDSTGLSIGHGVRHFASFSAAADEAGMSRLYGGIHFAHGNEGGKALGRCVGAAVAARLGAAATRSR